MAGCSAPAADADTDSALSWYAGDVHVHATGGSNDTDDVSTPAAIAEVARERGLDFVVITDHSNSTGSMHCADVEECPNLGPEFPHAEVAATLTGTGLSMVVGNELSPVSALGRPGPPTGHIGCLPPASGVFEFSGAFTDRPTGTVTSADAARQCSDAGGLAVLNHPYAFASWVRADWTTSPDGADLDGVEVWNGGSGWDLWDALSLRAWECLAIRALASGRVPPVPIAASDVHRVRTPADSPSATDPPLGRPRTSVRALSRAWPDLHAALAAGAPVVLHEDDTWLDPGGGRTPTAGRVELRGLRLGASDCDPSAADDLGPAHHDVIASQEVGPGEFTLDFTTDAQAKASPYYLILTRDDLPGVQAGDLAISGLH